MSWSAMVEGLVEPALSSALPLSVGVKIQLVDVFETLRVS